MILSLSALSSLLLMPSLGRSYSFPSAARRSFMKGAVATFTIAATEVANTQPTFGAMEYLSEPTDEFKASEAERMAFKKNQMQIKKAFDVVLDRFTNVSSKEKEYVNDLKELEGYVVRVGGLPLGIKADDVKKTVRRKKAKEGKNWPTAAEIAYQRLCREIAYQQNPNTEKGNSSPTNNNAMQ